MIKQLKLNRLNESIAIINNVKKKMAEQNILQWDEIYPTILDIEKDINNNQAFGFFEDDKLCAYIALNELYDPEYDALQWNVEGKALIVHRLSVDPTVQGKGIAKKLMLFAEEYAKDNGYKSVRLDAFPQNPAALKIYSTLMYTFIGTVTFRKGLFYCYEKRID